MLMVSLLSAPEDVFFGVEVLLAAAEVLCVPPALEVVGGAIARVNEVEFAGAFNAWLELDKNGNAV